MEIAKSKIIKDQGEYYLFMRLKLSNNKKSKEEVDGKKNPISKSKSKHQIWWPSSSLDLPNQWMNQTLKPI